MTFTLLFSCLRGRTPAGPDLTEDFFGDSVVHGNWLRTGEGKLGTQLFNSKGREFARQPAAQNQSTCESLVEDIRDRLEAHYQFRPSREHSSEFTRPNLQVEQTDSATRTDRHAHPVHSHLVEQDPEKPLHSAHRHSRGNNFGHRLRSWTHQISLSEQHELLDLIVRWTKLNCDAEVEEMFLRPTQTLMERTSTTQTERKICAGRVTVAKVGVPRGPALYRHAHPKPCLIFIYLPHMRIR